MPRALGTVTGVSRRRVLLGIAIATVALGAAFVHRLVTPVPS